MNLSNQNFLDLDIKCGFDIKKLPITLQMKITYLQSYNTL